MTNQRKLQDCEIPSFDRMVDHILADYALATRLPQVYDVGYFWYNQSNKDALQLFDSVKSLESGSLYTFKNVADVIAIISPSIAWAINLKDAKSVLFAHAYYKADDSRIAYCMDNGVSTPYGWANHRKAWNVLDGNITFDCKPTCLKTWNFGQNIEEPDSSLAVCIDQHMAHVLIADGLQGSMSIKPKQYKLFVSVIRHCAELLGILPSRLQAIIWQYRQYTLGYMVD